MRLIELICSKWHHTRAYQRMRKGTGHSRWKIDENPVFIFEWNWQKS